MRFVALDTSSRVQKSGPERKRGRGHVKALVHRRRPRRADTRLRPWQPGRHRGAKQVEDLVEPVLQGSRSVPMRDGPGTARLRRFEWRDDLDRGHTAAGNRPEPPDRLAVPEPGG